jgi:hypothetical protein
LLALHGDAAGGRHIAWPGAMQENCAAQALNARTLIEAKHRQHVVKAILAPQAFSALRVGVDYPPIVISIADGIAPAVGRPQWQDRETAAGPRHPIWTVKDLPDLPAADGRGSVALAFASASAGMAKRTGHSERSKRNPTARCRKRQGADPQPACKTRSGQRILLWAPRVSGARDTISPPGPVLHCGLWSAWEVER